MSPIEYPDWRTLVIRAYYNLTGDHISNANVPGRGDYLGYCQNAENASVETTIAQAARATFPNRKFSFHDVMDAVDLAIRQSEIRFYEGR